METQQVLQSRARLNVFTCWYCLCTDTTVPAGQGGWLPSKTFLSSDVIRCPRAYLLSELEVYQVCCGGGGWAEWHVFTVVRLYLTYSGTFNSSLDRSWKELCAFWMQLIQPVNAAARLHTRLAQQLCSGAKLTKCLMEFMCLCASMWELLQFIRMLQSSCA